MTENKPFKVYNENSVRVLAGLLKERPYNMIEATQRDVIFLNYRPAPGEHWQPVIKIKLRPNPPENLQTIKNKVMAVIEKYLQQPN